MAVYTHLTDTEIEAFAARYPVGQVLSCKGIAEGVENTNYLLITETGPYILTLYEKRVNPMDLPFFLQLMEHLAQKGISCPLPMSDHEGLALGRVAGKAAAIITFLNGQWPRDIDLHHCRALGFALGEMHIAAADFTLTRRNDLGVEAWRPLYQKSAARVDAVLPGAAPRIEADLTDLEANWPNDLPRGYVHADLFPDNVLFQGERLSGIIDFYFACRDAMLYDLAVCLNAWCFDGTKNFRRERAEAILSHYQMIRPLTDEEAAALPVLCRGAAMRFLLTRLHDWLNTPEDALVKAKDPSEFLVRLDFFRSAADPGALGLSA